MPEFRPPEIGRPPRFPLFPAVRDIIKREAIRTIRKSVEEIITTETKIAKVISLLEKKDFEEQIGDLIMVREELRELTGVLLSVIKELELKE